MAKSVWHRLTGVSEGGHFIPDDSKRSAAVLRSLEGKRVEVAVRRETLDRNLDQNALLHVLVHLIADHTGETVDRLKRRATLEAIGLERGLVKETILNREVLMVRHTSDLTKPECSEVIDYLKDKCSFLEIPLPRESEVEVM